MSSFPFYSSQVREALVEIISNHEEQQDEVDRTAAPTAKASLSTATNNAATSLRHNGTAIRGKWSGGYASPSSSDDDDDDDNDDGSDDDDEDALSSTSSTTSSMEAIQEDEEPANNAHKPKNGKHNTSKKSKNKKSKEEKMGKAPSILLPFHVKNTNNTTKKTTERTALEIPSVLLPTNYLRDNPSWNVSSVATSLLSSHDQLANASSSSSNNNPTILVVLLQSGRFAACAFSLQNNSAKMKMLAHKTSTRYTVRKGQGGSQSSNDQSKGKAKSIGAQLRREGEKQLRDDARSCWKEWKKLGYVQRAMYVYVSCPKGMRRDYLFGGVEVGSGSSGNAALIEKSDGRLRNVPLDVGRPTMEAAVAVLECVLNCEVREMSEEERGRMVGLEGKEEVGADKKERERAGKENGTRKEEKKVEERLEEAPPFTQLHQAILDGDLPRLLELLKLLDASEQQHTPKNYDINTTGGPDHLTPLHTASSSTHPNAPGLLHALLLQGHADPCIPDGRGRVPYFLASSDKLRETFRLARSALGEDYCEWDEGAKVGPALTEMDVQLKKEKALEKKRRQRAKQKEKKAEEKAAMQKEAAEERQEEEKEKEKKKEEQDAKRVRDGLKPKKTGASNMCDFCQKIVKGKRRSQMFQRLEYAYCSTECVKRHQRELMAAAAMARLG